MSGCRPWLPGSVEDALEDAGDHEGAGECRAGDDLGALGQGGLAAGRQRRLRAGGRRRDGGRARSAGSARAPLALAGGLLGLLARAMRRLLGLLGALALLALLARQILLGLLRVLDLVVRARRVLLRAASVRGGEPRAQLGGAGLGAGLLGAGGGLAGGGGLGRRRGRLLGG